MQIMHAWQLLKIVSILIPERHGPHLEALLVEMLGEGATIDVLRIQEIDVTPKKDFDTL